VDMEGGLLSKGYETDMPGTLSESQFEYRNKLGKSLEERIRTMLEPVVGSNSVVARVSAEVDFRQVNISEERFDPDSSVVRSEQRQKEISTGGQTLPAGSPDLKYEIYQTQGESTTTAAESFEKKNEVINYEINRTNKQVVSSVGDIKRLSAAVIIDGPYVPEQDGEGNVVKKFAARNRREMKGFEEIVKKAMGFDETRGDQVTVSNIPFAMQEEEKVEGGGKFGWLDYARKASRPLFNVGLVLLFFFVAVRPFRRWLNQAKEYMGPQALTGGKEIRRLESPDTEGTSHQIEKEQILDITRTEPERVAAIIRGWIREGS